MKKKSTDAQFQREVNMITTEEIGQLKASTKEVKEITDFEAATLEELKAYHMHLVLHTTKPVPMTLMRAIRAKS